MVLLIKQSYCQDVEFSQYYANPLYLNPAFAGSDNYARVSLNYRTILPTSFGDYSTYSASLDKYYDELSGGVGFQIMNIGILAKLYSVTEKYINLFERFFSKTTLQKPCRNKGNDTSPTAEAVSARGALSDSIVSNIKNSVSNVRTNPTPLADLSSAIVLIAATV